MFFVFNRGNVFDEIDSFVSISTNVISFVLIETSEYLFQVKILIVSIGLLFHFRKELMINKH